MSTVSGAVQTPTGTPAAQLWAVHLQGWDHILAMPSKEAAEEYKGLADIVDSRRGGPLAAELSLTPALSAKVIPWPYSPEAHAASLAKQDAEKW